MGGYPASTGAQEATGSFPASARRFSAGGGDLRAPSQENVLNLLTDAFPGLAGALHASPLYHDGLMLQGLGGWALQRNPRSFGAGTGTPQEPALTRSVSEILAPYADQPSFQLTSAAARKKHTPGRRYAPKAQQSPPGPQTAAALDTKDNINDLARIITSEASVGNGTERSSVGFAVLNRMHRNGTARVRDVCSGFSEKQTPTPDAVSLATKILRNQLADPTNGATHFYSPINMPKEGQNTGRADIGGGLEQSGDLPKRNFRPGYTKSFSAMKIPEVRDKLFRFYRAPGYGTVD